MLTIIEKVIILQDIDIFEHTHTEDLAHIAAIVEELEIERNRVIFTEGDIPDSMYIVIEGSVRLERDGQEVMLVGSREVFGSWALFDDEPRVVTATALEDCSLLRIDKEEFIDLLADHVQITRSVLKTMVKRLRSLISRVVGRGTA